MDLTWFRLQFHYKYYQYLYYKLCLQEYWKNLSKTGKISGGFTLFAALCTASWFVYKCLKGREEELKALLDCDFNDERKTSRRRKRGFPPGLFNEGNTCFANCLLQALSSCPSFIKWIQDISSQINVSDATVVPSVQKLMKVLVNSTGNEDVYSASDVFSSLRAHGWVISADQQDAYEFYQLLLTTIEEEVQKYVCGANKDYFKIQETWSVSSTILNKVSQQLPQLFSGGYTLPMKGSFANKMTCLVCGVQLAVKFENFESLMLSLQGFSPYGSSLNICLQKWIESELVHDVECINCLKSTGKKYSSFTKQLSIAKLPRCLCIQLQRTYYTNSGYPIKNAMYVKFEEYLNISEYTYQYLSYKEKLKNCKFVNQSRLLGGSTKIQAESSKEQYGMYKLMAVVLHYGKAENGHFSTCRRLPEKPDKWVYISDQCVRIVSHAEVFLSTAYLLFYERVK